MERVVRIVLIVLLIALRVFFGAPAFFLGEEGWLLRACSYSFFHASWWHLAVNAIAIWSIYSPRYGCKPCRDLLFPFLIAVAVYPLSLRPVIGFSNILYATLGMRTPSLRSRWWRQPSVIVFLVVTIALLFVPQFSATTHIASFIIGMALASLHRLWLKVSADARRYY